MSDSHDPIKARVPDARSEARILDIREEAERTGRVTAPGVRLPGAPFPVASPERGYYGIPLLKQPQWTWEIPIYFFIGGAAGASAVIGAMARWTGRDEKIARDSRYVAAGGAIASTALLISDLGRPERFLNMLRVIKHQSPMSVGAWTLAFFGTFSGAAAMAQFVDDRMDLTPVRLVGDLAEGLSGLLGMPLATYTGVLIGSTVIPVWNHNIKSLPVHFGTSGLNSAVSVLELMGSEDSYPLNLLGIGACALETYEGVHLELRRDPRVNRPLKHGLTGWVTRAGGVLSGPLPLALRAVSAFMRGRNARQLRRAAALSSLLGSLCTRFGWVYAGHESAKDWRLPLGLAEESLDKPMQSIQEFPEVREKARVEGASEAEEATG